MCRALERRKHSLSLPTRMPIDTPFSLIERMAGSTDTVRERARSYTV